MTGKIDIKGFVPKVVSENALNNLLDTVKRAHDYFERDDEIDRLERNNFVKDMEETQSLSKAEHRLLSKSLIYADFRLTGPRDRPVVEQIEEEEVKVKESTKNSGNNENTSTEGNDADESGRDSEQVDSGHSGAFSGRSSRSYYSTWGRQSSRPVMSGMGTSWLPTPLRRRNRQQWMR